MNNDYENNNGFNDTSNRDFVQKQENDAENQNNFVKENDGASNFGDYGNVDNNVMRDDVITRTETPNVREMDAETSFGKEYDTRNIFQKTRDNYLSAREKRRAKKEEKRAAKLEKKSYQAKKPKLSYEEKLQRKNEKIAIKEDLKRQKHLAALEKKRDKMRLKDEMRAKKDELKRERLLEQRRLKELRRGNKPEYRRVIAEKKLAEKEEKRARKIARKREGIELKREKKEAIETLRARGIKVGRSKGLVAAVIVLAIVSGLMTIGTVGFGASSMYFMEKSRNTETRSYYDLVDNMNNMETALSKALISKSPEAESRALTEAKSYAVAGASNLDSLPQEAGETAAIYSYFNGVAKVADTLATSTAQGKNMSDEEEQMLASLINYHNELKEVVNSEYEKNKTSEDLFKSNILTRKMAENPLTTTYSSFTNGIDKMPVTELSGGNASAQGLEENTKSVEKGVGKEQLFETVKKALNAESVSCDGVCQNTDSEVYNLKAVIKGREFHVQADAESGKVLSMDYYREVPASTLSLSEAEDKAAEFLKSINVENVERVWEEKRDNVAVITFATVTKKTVAYGESIIVKVALDNGEILGFEASEYVKNFNAKRDYSVKLSLKQARNKVSDKLEITSERLAAIDGADGEILAYEFKGNYLGMSYVVYIDANEGNEIKILRVIHNENGDLVL